MQSYIEIGNAAIYYAVVLSGVFQLGKWLFALVNRLDRH